MSAAIPGAQGNSPIYVSQPGQAVGWGAVEKAVREDDEHQVRSCKEDIDTLLTFAGLYSAALTALLALSFNMLQEDVPGETLKVLRQISQQTATYQLLPNGMLNATFSVISSSGSVAPFEPPPGAVRVNVLWFASLVFSLSTASIGILVKQWLRAYTTYKTSSAQGRMRVRDFRRQGVEIWKVYEIAGALPFLIQLALGLFFIGLCYFTAEVHPALGHTTLPLVAGWAFFLFAATTFPAFSPHCPYKAASFEVFFSSVRRALFSTIAAIKVTDGVRRWAQKRTPACQAEHRPYDEGDAIHYAQKDVDILVTADALQSDDELLGTAILEALKQSKVSLGQEHAIKFLLGVLRNRLQWEGNYEDEATCIDCTTLTFRARTAVVDILVQTCGDEMIDELGAAYIRSFPTHDIGWALCILLSPSQYNLNSNGLQFLGKMISVAHPMRMMRYVYRKTKEHPASTIRTLLSAVYLSSSKEDTPSISTCYTANQILEYYFYAAKLPNLLTDGALSLVKKREDDPEEWGEYLNQRTLTEIILYLADSLRRELRAQPDGDHTPVSHQQDAHNEVLAFIFRLSALVTFAKDYNEESPVRGALREVTADFLGASGDLKTLMQVLVRALIRQPGRFVDRTDIIIIHNPHMTPNNGVDKESLSRLHAVIKDITTDPPSEFGIAHAIHLCYVAMYILRYYCGVQKWQIEEKQIRIWRSIFRHLTAVLEKMPLDEHELASDDARLVELFFWFIDRIDTDRGFTGDDVGEDEKHERTKTLDWQQSIFRNHFVLTLLRFNVEVTPRPFWRMTTLLGMSDEERLIAVTDDELDDLPIDPETGLIITSADEANSPDGPREGLGEENFAIEDPEPPPSPATVHPVNDPESNK